MKRISRSLLSLCLAFVLCAALLPNVNVANAAGEGDGSSGGAFMVTGYDVSSSSITTGDSVDITLYLYCTANGTDGNSIRVIRNIDSFQGDSTYYASASSSGDGTTYTVKLRNLTYTGASEKQLSFTIYYNDASGNGHYQNEKLQIRECVPYTEPKPEPEPTPETIPEPRAVFNSDGMSTAIAAGQTKTITVYIQNAGTTTMRDPILTLKSSGSLLIMGSQDYMLDDIRAGRDTAVTVTVKALDKIESQMQTIDATLSFYYDNGTQLTGGSASGSVTKLVNNMAAGAYLVAIAEAYAFAAKAGIDLQTTFDATRGGFAGGPLYDNKVPKLIHRDYEPGARIAVHRKDIVNAKHFAHHMGVDTPMTDVVLMVMDWMKDNGHIDEDQIAMVKYYEDKMDVHVGSADN